MSNPSTFSLDAVRFDEEAIQVVTAMNDGLVRTVSIATLLVDNGRNIDLTGLEHGVGLLCAKALDLQQENGRSARPHLIALLAELDRLSEALHRRADKHA